MIRFFTYLFRAVLILKQLIDRHDYALLSDLEKREQVVRWAQCNESRLIVETGTYHGCTAEYLALRAPRVISIELDKQLASAAQKRLQHLSTLTIIQGHSVTELDRIAYSMDERTLFYLDAHYCGEGTAHGKPPIIDEIDTLLRYASRNPIILIDDARCYLGYNGYPSIRQLRKLVNRLAPHYAFRVHNDMIAIYNPRLHDRARAW